jgi:hypothetical protein
MRPTLSFGPLTRDFPAPRSRADLAREEQAFYEDHANSEPWKTALKRLAAIPVAFAVFVAFVGLSHALR